MRLRAIACALLLLAVAGTAHAEQYEVFINIDTEEDLYDLFSEGQISEDTFNTLLEIYQRGVDLNDAGRAELYTLPNLTLSEVDKILAYRAEAGWIGDPAVLSVNGILADEKLLAIAPFLRIRNRALGAYAVDGLVRAQTRWSNEDDRVPPFSVLARVSTLKHLRLGFAGFVSRNDLGSVVYDPNRNALIADPQATRLDPVKAYAMWETDDYAAVVGTYRVGFGQRLTFDNTSQSLPNGLYTDDQITRSTDLTRLCKESRGELAAAPCDDNVYVTPDFNSTERLLGVAAGARQLPVGPGIVQAYAWASVQPKGIYQYELYDRGRCADPTDDSDPDCSAPQVYKRQDDLLAPTSRYSFMTLPDMYRENVFGGNVSYFASSRMHLGITGYGASIDWLTEGIDLDFQEWARTPYGGGFGAVGTDFAFGVNEWLDLFGELTQSWNNQGEGAVAPAGILRALATWNNSKNELEASFRAYGTDFTNPYARPISAADEFDGLRARDEVGGRLRFSGLYDKRLNLRSTLDVWNTPSDEQSKILVYGRADYDLNKRTRVGAYGQFQDKGLDQGGRGQCFEVSVEDDERGEPIPCGGQKWTGAVTGKLAPSRLWFTSGQVQMELVDDGRYDDRYRKDLSAFFTATVKPASQLRLRGRLRYLFEDISDNQYLEQSVWAYVEATYSLPRKYRVRVRYDYVQRIDDRTSTADRTPNPESWLWLEVESKF